MLYSALVDSVAVASGTRLVTKAAMPKPKQMPRPSSGNTWEWDKASYIAWHESLPSGKTGKAKSKTGAGAAYLSHNPHKDEAWDRAQNPYLRGGVEYMFDDDGDVEEASCRDAADGSTQTVAPEQKPQPDLMREALRARDRLRWAERLQRKKLKGETRFTRQEQALLEDLAAGTLHDAADSATRKSGWGRIKHPDGSFEEVSPQCGLIVRTLLDNIDPMSTDDECLDAEP